MELPFRVFRLRSIRHRLSLRLRSHMRGTSDEERQEGILEWHETQTSPAHRVKQRGNDTSSHMDFGSVIRHILHIVHSS